MEGDLYDEFGNYIGPDLDGSDDSESASDGEQQQQQQQQDDGDEQEHGAGAMDVAPHGDFSQAVVLGEDKKYYPSAEEVYGPGTETLVEEEDAQPIEVPLVAPVRPRRLDVEPGGAGGAGATGGTRDLAPHAPPEFLAALLATPATVRNVAVLGHLHHGKTSLMDALIGQSHSVRGGPRPPGRPARWTDTRLDEQARGVSLKAAPMTLVLPDARGKSFALNLIDAPGHPNFADEVAAAARLADGALLVVDAAEGVLMGTELAVAAAAAEGLRPVLLLSKLDRLILELKLPPADAYHKLRHVLEEVNALIRKHYPGDAGALLDPGAGTVAFAAPGYGWSFTLPQFAELYAERAGPGVPLDAAAFAARLWGDVYFQPESRGFRRKPPPGGGERTFVQFVLEPLYKVHALCVGEEPGEVMGAMAALGVRLAPGAAEADAQPLLAAALGALLGPATGLVTMLARHVPSPRAGAPAKVERLYTGPQDGALAAHMRACNAAGPAVVAVAKLVPRPDAGGFDALCRVMSGAVAPGDRLRVLGEAYTPDDEEDSAPAAVAAVWALQARYRVPLPRACAGAWCLLAGVDATIAKTATLVAESLPGVDEPPAILRPLRLGGAARAVVRLAAEPLNPGELPRLVEGLRSLSKSYPALVTRVEESGEHTLAGTGELYLDSAMKDLRELYGGVEVKVADPAAAFAETVVETSSLRCFAETPNRRNKLTLVAEPLGAGLADALEAGGAARPGWGRRQLSAWLQADHGWDLLAARRLWAFGPDPAAGPNALVDDTLAEDTDRSLLAAVRESVVQGFRWGAREGPLCDEPMRGVRFRLLAAELAAEPAARGGGQVIPAARRAAYSAFLTASPRLMEPVLAVEIVTPADCVAAVYSVLSKRRGHVVADAPRPGTPVFTVRATLPVIESFGFETDLRYHTQGAAFGLSAFDHWAVVPGDPLDRSVVLRPLEPAPLPGLARDFMVKTRRRKGMADDVSVAKYFDDPMLLELAAQDAALGGAAL